MAQYDLILRGGRVVDPGSDVDAIRDVALTAGKISAVAEKVTADSRRSVDVSGLVVTAGFIDLHSHSDTIAALRLQALDGVTTALEFEAGVVPVHQAYASAGLEGRPVHYGFSASWAQARMEVLAGHTPDGSLAGFLRNIADPLWQRRASHSETAQIRELLEDQLAAGSLGIGILAAYAPHAEPGEYLSVATLAAKAKVPTFTHIRDLAEFTDSAEIDGAEELVQAAGSTGAHMHFCHIHASCRRHIARVLALISRTRQEGSRVTTEAYPYGTGMTGIGAAFLDPPGLAKRGFVPESLWFVPTAERVRDVGQLRALRASNPGGLVFIENLREEDPADYAMILEALLFEDGIIASDAMPLTWDGPPSDPLDWPISKRAVTHPRTAGTFSRAIRMLHREQGNDLTSVLRRCSLLPAEILEESVPAMRAKGRVAVGCDADITVFDPDLISDRSSYTSSLEPSSGIEHVLVDGVFVVEDGRLVLHALPGRAVRR